MSRVRKKSVSYEAYYELELKLVSFAQEIKDLIAENRRLMAENELLQGKLDAGVPVAVRGSYDRALLEAIKTVKLPDYKSELAVLLRGNDLILSLLKAVLNERRMGT